MRGHFHNDVVFVAAATVSVIIGINVWRIAAAKLAQAPGPAGTIGVALGGLTHWGS